MLVDAMTAFYPAEDISPSRLPTKIKPPDLADFRPAASGRQSKIADIRQGRERATEAAFAVRNFRRPESVKGCTCLSMRAFFILLPGKSLAANAIHRSR